MLKRFSMLVLAGGITFAGVDSVSAATGGCAPAATVAAQAATPRAPVAAARSGTQTIRRYSAAPGYSRAPVMRSYRSSGSSGPSYSATRKILGY